MIRRCRIGLLQIGLLIFVAFGLSAGCRNVPPLSGLGADETTVSGGNVPSDAGKTIAADDSRIVPPLDPSQSNPAYKPVLVQLPRDNTFSSWRSEAFAGGWIAAGGQYSASDGAQGRLDCFSKTGELIWRYIRPSARDHCLYACAARLADGRTAAGGSTAAADGPQQGLLTLLDSGGKLLWERLLTDETDRQGLQIEQCVQVADGSLAVAALSTQSDAGGNGNSKPVCLASYTAEGQLNWLTAPDIGGQAYTANLLAAADGSLFLAVSGYLARADGYSDAYALLLHLNAKGEEIWRCNLTDGDYIYQPAALAVDGGGSVWLSCSAEWRGELPRQPAESAGLRERYRRYAFYPAALLKVGPEGQMTVEKKINGAFGATGKDLYLEQDALYWLVSLYDDVVKSLPIMSVDHMRIGHDVLVVGEPEQSNLQYYHLFATESGSWTIQSLEDRRPVLIGFQPYVWEGGESASDSSETTAGG